MKMSDVFTLPVSAVSGFDDFYVRECSQLNWIDEQADAAVHAVNCHDGLVEALEMFEKAVDLWLPDIVSKEHEGEAEALHNLRCHMLIVLAKAKGE